VIAGSLIISSKEYNKANEGIAMISKAIAGRIVQMISNKLE